MSKFEKHLKTICTLAAIGVFFYVIFLIIFWIIVTKGLIVVPILFGVIYFRIYQIFETRSHLERKNDNR